MTSLLRSTSRVSMMTFISRILGFIRDMLAAQMFGTGPEVDAFYIAFKIPNFMRNLFAEGAFSQAFVPVLSEYRQTKPIKDTRTFINHMAGNLAIILSILTLLGILNSSLIIHLFGFGLDPLRFQYASDMLKITFPYLMLISLTAFCGSVLNTYGRFVVPAFTPALLNIVLILAAVLCSPYLKIPIESQAIGVFIAGVAQLLFQIPFLISQDLLPKPRVNWRDPGVRRVLKLMLPSLFGASVTNISLLLNSIFASFLTTGSIAWLYYSERLAYLPLGVFGVAIATVVLPHLSRKHAENSFEQFQRALDWGIRCNLLIGVPSTIALIFFGGPIIISLFAHSKFNLQDALMTRESLIAYAIGLQAFMGVKLFSTAFYAQQNVKTPVKIATFSVLCNMILNALLLKPFAHAGLALATSLSAWINTLILGFLLYKKGVYRLQPGWGRFAIDLLISNGLLACVLLYAHGHLTTWYTLSGLNRFALLFGWIFIAIILYGACLYILGYRIRNFRGI